MAKGKKAGSNASRQGSVTPSVSSIASSTDQKQNDVNMESPLSTQFQLPPPSQVPIMEEEEENINVSFQSRHNASAEKPNDVAKRAGSNRQMHQRAGLVFNCYKIRKALRKGNYAERIQPGKQCFVNNSNLDLTGCLKFQVRLSIALLFWNI